MDRSDGTLVSQSSHAATIHTPPRRVALRLRTGGPECASQPSPTSTVTPTPCRQCWLRSTPTPLMPCGASAIRSATARGRTSAARSCGRWPRSASSATTTCLRSAPTCSKGTSIPTRARQARWTRDVLDASSRGFLERPRARGSPGACRALPCQRPGSGLGVRARWRVRPGDLRADAGAARARRPQPRPVRHLARWRRARRRARSGRHGDRPLPWSLALQPRLRRAAAGWRLLAPRGCYSTSRPAARRSGA